LYLAVHSGSIESIRLLVEAGANVNRPTSFEKNTPLHLAVEKNWKDICRYLIEKGADVRACNVMMRTPLHCAAVTGRLEIGVMLLKAGALPNATDINGWNARYVMMSDVVCDSIG
jgi:ankyrin repeat protein